MNSYNRNKHPALTACKTSPFTLGCSCSIDNDCLSLMCNNSICSSNCTSEKPDKYFDDNCYCESDPECYSDNCVQSVC